MHGLTCARLFVGNDTGYLYVRLMRTESEGPAALQEFITDVAAPKTLHSDRSKMQLGRRFAKICRDLYIK